jgi:hypothetical protein
MIDKTEAEGLEAFSARMAEREAIRNRPWRTADYFALLFWCLFLGISMAGGVVAYIFIARLLGFR